MNKELRQMLVFAAVGVFVFALGFIARTVTSNTKPRTEHGTQQNNQKLQNISIPPEQPPQQAERQQQPEQPHEPADSASTHAEPEVPPTDQSKRVDPPNEASNAQIGNVLRQSEGIEVNCGDDVDMQTCKFFVNVLAAALKNERVTVYLFYEPETLVQSFYVPGRLVATRNDVTLRLMESGPEQPVNLYVGGFCFDPDRKDYFTGLRLPTWVQPEGGKDYGPLESEKAEAARKAAMAFATYWVETASKNSSQPHQTVSQQP